MKYLGFQLDPFQEEAVRAVDEGESLIVAAPTGCGKTLIAEYAVDAGVRAGRHTIYTAPIKALSNQKYRDFRGRYGTEAVGIHTGDVTMNPEAPLLIMTTEIFRNLILEHSPRLDNVHYAIFDEIHYLDDPDRGTVWEESIILAPRQIRFMCLSATVPNIFDLAAWMGKVRGCRFRTIVEKKRPVPLKHHLFSAKYGMLTLKDIRRRYRKNPRERKKFLHRKPTSKKIIATVLRRGNFPVLYFCFNRRACERNAEMHRGLDLVRDEERQRIRTLVDELAGQYRLDGYERLGPMRRLWECGCAYHHAGILPAAKEIVERLFSEGLIKLLFCTETFALGINMPANSVIFDEVEKFDGVDFSYLMTRDYHQMAGRAGRRGIDEVGYVYSQVVPEATDPKQIERILYGKNEPIRSRFAASYATILNLYSRFGDGIYDIVRQSLSNYRGGEFVFTGSYRREEGQISARIEFLQATGFLDGFTLTEKGRLAAGVNGYEIQAAELYYSRSFEECTVAQLPVVLGALVTEEPRRGARAKAVSNVRLRFAAEKIIEKLRRREIRHGITAPVPPMQLYCAAPIFAWANGCSLRELEAFGLPEGDLIRLLRMTVQLLRTLRDKLPDPVVADRMNEALLLVNRDVVDAQAQLEAGV